MNKYSKVTIIPVYLFILFYLVDFKLSLIIDVKMMFVMLGCISLLYLSSYKKDNIDRVRLFGMETLLTSVLAATLLFLKMLSLDAYSLEPVRPFFYGVFYFIIFKIGHDLYGKVEENFFDIDKFNLTEREKMLAELLLKEKTNKQIAATLFIAESTVKKHLQNIYRKTETKDRHDFIKKIRPE
ncbi:helix-turn-helix transcriptional regulator [Acidaminobacter sp. JC074]|uniref:helix-turn-helix domain-containing protein n=1 Tax=Acidaminobacter sp. JC074 TaxID=2530199 RepID=UPI001F10FBE3|nr:helix-turn-helix transcriptional regulator [Acidaminobacter sp. JC074]MCH4889083.1 helix-turn-helix transcriptional regulator [Acidaminobacter sp. JC074]